MTSRVEPAEDSDMGTDVYNVLDLCWTPRRLLDSASKS